jgi:hypothetical protein
MADEGTASTLVLVGAILQLIVFIASLAMIGLAYLSFAPFLMDPILGPMFMMAFIMTVVIYLLYSIFGIIFMILWFRWRGSPSAHKTALIVTGILGIILAGFIPGLLVMIAGIITPST